VHRLDESWRPARGRPARRRCRGDPQVLQRLVARRGLELFVHPPPPVLDETRPVVAQFTRLLGRSVLEAAAQPGCAGRLHWLELSGELLGPDGKLREEFVLDGTHLAPAYLRHLQAALRRV
jgi:hypothetical protein